MTYSRATGSENYRLPSVAGSRVLPVTEKSAVPIPNDKKPASNPVLTTDSPVTENCRFRSAAGYREICCFHPDWQGTSFKSIADKSFTGYRVLMGTSWTGSFFSKIPLTNRFQSLPTECRFTQPSVTVASQELEIQ